MADGFLGRFVAGIAFSLLFLACSSSREQAFREIGALLQKAETATIDCEARLKKASTDQQAADALLKFAAALLEVKEGFRMVDEKYPDLKKEDTMPPAVEESYNRLRELSNSLGEVINASQQKFQNSKVFKEAFESMTRSVL